jgi:tetratricopeptide (TPR) repeat protein
LALAGLVALTIATPLIPGEGAAELGTGAMLCMLWCVLLVGWLAAGLVAGRLRVRGGWGDVTVGLFFGWIAVSGWMSLDTGYPRATINMLWQWASFGICFFLVRQLVCTGLAMRAVGSALLGLAVALSLLSFYQFFYSLPATRAAYQRDPEAMLLQAGIDVAEGSPERKLFEDRLYSTEPSATFALANSLAGFLAPWFVLALGIGLTVDRWSTQHSRTLLAAGALSLCIGFCLLLTKSRTAVLAVAAAAAALAGWRWRRGRRLDWRVALAGAAAAGVLAVGVLAAGFRDCLVLSEAPKSVLYRLQYWQSTAALIADHPWFGCGPGNFQQTYTRYKLPEASESISDPHNFLLEVWATAGTPALLALLAMLVWLARAVLRGGDLDEDPGASTSPAGQRDMRAAWWVYGSAGAGLLLGYVAAAAAGYPADLAVLWLGLPAGGAAVWSLHRWTAAGTLPVWLLAGALLALTINLLAAGGFTFAGVAIGWWLLAALILNRAGHGPQLRNVPPAAAVAVTAAAVLLAGVCYGTLYRPVLACQAALVDGAMAQQAGLLQQAEDAYRRAAREDPYSAEPWLNLAALHAEIICATGDRGRLAEFEEAVRAFEQRRGTAHTTYRRIGDWRLNLFSKLGESLQLQYALQAYTKWTELYPNDSLAHAQLAWTRHLAGDQQAAARAARRALELDAENPHRERKLANQSVHDPTGRTASGVDAEQLMLGLRS